MTIVDDAACLLAAADPEGLPLRVDGATRYRLHLSYSCSLDGVGTYLSVESSEFQLSSEGHGEPLLRLDYDRNARKVPSSHFNVHSHHPALQEAMGLAGKGSRAKKKPKPETLHLPTGGRRFRPSLEDFLEAIILDFKLDAESGWEDRLAEGRRSFKWGQLAAAVRDDPQCAIDVLNDMGFVVSWEGQARAPGIKLDRIQQL
ncbi:UNVERIFIED_CONTAM: hypothetical protein RF649_02180 [Kocuria sp. CPCC 205295]|uniref:hypothetical protein n=1 Tax=unclassified Kocuria TaxID=2649579 RepID=UPI0034D68539